MTADEVLKYLIYVTAPAQTLFVLIYGFGSPWWRTLLGRALLTKALGLALLVDLSLLYRVLGENYFLRDPVRVSVFGLIAVGAWLQLVALLKERRATHRENRRSEL